MAVVVPAVMAFAAAGGTVAGVTAALTGAAGFASFAMVAGGFLQTLGGLTKSKTLGKVGSLLSLAGGIMSVGNAIADGVGSVAADAAGEAAGEAAKAVGEEAAGAAVEAGSSAAADGVAAAMDPAAAAQAGGTIDLSATGVGQAATEQAVNSGSFLEQARLAKSLEMPGLNVSTPPLAGVQTGMPSASSSLAQAAGEIRDASHLQSLLDKAGAASKSLGGFVRENKELVQLAGGALESVFDPRREAMDQQMSLLEQRRRRLNSPIQLGIRPAPSLGG